MLNIIQTWSVAMQSKCFSPIDSKTRGLQPSN